MHSQDYTDALEALLFAAKGPMDARALRRALKRYVSITAGLGEDPADSPEAAAIEEAEEAEAAKVLQEAVAAAAQADAGAEADAGAADTDDAVAAPQPSGAALATNDTFAATMEAAADDVDAPMGDAADTDAELDEAAGTEVMQTEQAGPSLRAPRQSASMRASLAALAEPEEPAHDGDAVVADTTEIPPQASLAADELPEAAAEPAATQADTASAASLFDAVDADAAEAAEPEDDEDLAQTEPLEAAAEVDGEAETSGTAADKEQALVLTSPRPRTTSFPTAFARAFAALQARWAKRQMGGFRLVEVADGWAFRSHPRFGGLLAQVREAKPVKLSRPAMEALAIVAYRQPVTKPEMDHMRGVDCGNSLRLLLERNLIVITGKKEEPGRPLLYGTTPYFLEFFNLPSLSSLPSLRQYQELNEDNEETLRAFEGLPSLADLAAGAKTLAPEDASQHAVLDEAMASLQLARGAARAAFLQHGIALDEVEEGDAGAPRSAAPQGAPEHGGAGANTQNAGDAPGQTVH